LIDSPFSSLKALFHISKLQSLPPVAKKSPFLEKAQAFIYPLWPYIVYAKVPFTISHTLISLLAETDIMCVPSGWIENWLTASWWAS
jgi:hypothetical protein